MCLLFLLVFSVERKKKSLDRILGALSVDVADSTASNTAWSRLQFLKESEPLSSVDGSLRTQPPKAVCGQEWMQVV